MKFAFVIFKYFPFGGVQRDMLRIARESMKLGHEVHIFTGYWEGEIPVEQGLHPHVIEARGWFNHWRYRDFIGKVEALLDAGKFDLVVGFNRLPGLDAYFQADPCFLERTAHARPPLYRLTGRYRFFAESEAAVFGRDSRCEILLLSPSEKLVFQRWYDTPDARFHLQPPPIAADRFGLGDREKLRAEVRAEFGFDADDKLILMVGSAFKRKGLDRVIQAVAALPDALKSHVRLLAVGQDDPAPFLKLAQSLGASGQLRILSEGRDDIPRLMQAADLLAHVAYSENTGVVLIESMASGLPVLASAECGYAFHVRASGAGGVTGAPFDQKEFNRQLADMLVSPLLPVWRENALRYVTDIMAANNGGAEARMLETFARRKQEHAR
ncbi:MAG: glycosyltransferase family 4 protein [Methylobacillus sp.]|jgi:UDP-glucose:(heptosyl)LPS alpha-1,3-glucosyltransferase|nr:glycosyltransferase family 4 protein [Methylobacillus sp.]